jgi:hypothetical protein
MSLSTTTRRNDYTGNGSNSVYAYSFKIFSQSDLQVTVRSTDDVETTLTLTTDYTVSSVGSTSGGNVTLVNASQAWLTAGKLTSGYILTIRRVVTLTQNTDIRNQGSFYPETHEEQFDYQTMIDQQQQDEINRSVKLAETVSSDDFDPTLPADIQDHAGEIIIVNADGDGLDVGGNPSSIPTFYAQATRPSDPSSSNLAFWYDTTVDQMKIWCRTEWRVIA